MIAWNTKYQTIHKAWILIVIVVCLPVFQVFAQGEDSTASRDLFDRLLDIFEIPLNKRIVARNHSIYPTKLVLSPVVYYSPETNWGGGVGAKLLFKFPGSGEKTRTSNMPMSAIFTLNDQLIVYSGYTIFFNQEKYLLKGNLLYSKFPQLYYGIGNATPKRLEEEYVFDNILIEPLLLRNVRGKLFVGGGIRYNRVYNVALQEEGKLIHFPVSGSNGFTALGAEFALTFDNRDNVLNASRGMLVEFTHGVYGKLAGGTHAFQLSKVDIRQYIKLFRNRNDILAFQLLGYFSSGDVPLMELAALGGSRMMRGYYEGRYRDRNMLATQVEYRLALTPRLGLVAFAGLGDVADRFRNFHIRSLKYSMGLGVRFKIIKEENLNIRLDYGFGRSSSNYYFDIAETF